MLLDTHASEIETLLAKYPSKRSAVLPLLYIAQDAYGYLTSEAIREVAAILQLPPTDVFEVVGFYSLFYERPVGTWMLQVCDDVPCCYLGAEDLIAALRQTLGIAEEQTTADGMFTLQRVKCLAACNRAPVLQANLDYVYDVTPDKVDSLLNDLRARAGDARKRGLSGRFAEDFTAGADSQVAHQSRDDAYVKRSFEIAAPAAPAAPLPPPEAGTGADDEKRPSPL
jgi:NADH-quinone oxidoreductase subunit E